MSKDVMYERDLLYPTENLYEPGSVHIKLLNPGKDSKLPLIIECKTSHSPIKYMKAILKVVQCDVFDRINLDIRNNTRILLKACEELKNDYKGFEYIEVGFSGEKAEFRGTNDI